MFYDGKPQFFGVRAEAANITRGHGRYTAELFQEDFPQFFGRGSGAPRLPSAKREAFIRPATAALTPARGGEGWG